MVATDAYSSEVAAMIEHASRPRQQMPVAQALHALLEREPLEHMNRYTFIGRMLDLMPVAEEDHEIWEPALSSLYKDLRTPWPPETAERP